MSEIGQVSAAALRDRLAIEGPEAASSSKRPLDHYAGHRHGYDQVLVAAAGSITFHGWDQDTRCGPSRVTGRDSRRPRRTRRTWGLAG